MKILYSQGGLGNQMFQYAYVKYLESRGHQDIWIDSSAPSLRRHHGFEIRRIFPKVNLHGRYLPYIIGRPLHIFCYYILKFCLRMKNIESEGEETLWIRGYWQDVRYTEPIRETLLSEFEFRPIDDPVNAALIEQINGCNAVSLHVRRGDYMHSQNRDIFWGLCNDDYYRRAVEHIRANVENPRFFIFSDDVQWVKDNLGMEDAVVVDNNSGRSSFRDMQLMSACSHNIIANSSFSWWGAWLNRNPEKIVIAPAKWFNNSTKEFEAYIVPDWVRL